MARFRQEVVGFEVGGRAPLGGPEDLVAGRPGKGFDVEVDELDGAVLVGAGLRPVDDGADIGVDVQLFAELAPEGGGRGLAGMRLAAGKLPLEGVRAVFAALAGEQSAAALDEADGDGEGGVFRLRS